MLFVAFQISAQVSVTFNVDMNLQAQYKGFDLINGDVWVQGSNGMNHQLSDGDADGIFSVTISDIFNNEDEIQYRFIKDGEWEHHYPEMPGDHGNRVATASADLVLDHIWDDQI